MLDGVVLLMLCKYKKISLCRALCRITLLPVTHVLVDTSHMDINC